MTALAEVLASVDEWEPDTIAVGVRTGVDVAATHGPTDRVFELASVTKPLTAYSTLVAIRDGLVHLDEPIGPVEGATVRHLLAHAGGLPMDPKGILGRPERRRVYSNWGYDLLGARVADRAGMSFGAYLDPRGAAAARDARHRPRGRACEGRPGQRRRPARVRG
jgi:CubicO group peptidase (beta-lactamase class C family)